MVDKTGHCRFEHALPPFLTYPIQAAPLSPSSQPIAVVLYDLLEAVIVNSVSVTGTMIVSSSKMPSSLSRL